MRIAVIITCYNRKDKTVKCIEHLKKQFDNSDIDYDIHLTDDGCTDGTSNAVKEIFPNVIIYKGENLYWAGGMRLAWKGAYEKGGYDYFMFLNDDTFVNDNLVEDFYECYKYTNKNAIIVCNVCDPISKKRTYAGDIIQKIPFRVFHLIPSGYPQYVSYSGANCMFVPCEIVDKVGFFPDIYIHAIADLDYCLRVQRFNYKVVMTSRFCGECESDHGTPTVVEMKKMGIVGRYKWLISPKGKSAKQYLYYQSKFFPWRVPLVLLKMVAQLFFGIKD